MPENFREVGTDANDLNDCIDLCLATGIGGSVVSESLEIVRVCQDPNNLGIIYMELVLSGVFDYSPHLILEWETPDGVVKSVDVTTKIIMGYKNATDSPGALPIVTNCGTVNLLLAWDVASLIPDWGSLTSINCKLMMVGNFITHSFDPELLQKIANLFVSINPAADIVLVKGPTPVPFALYFDEATGQLKIQYSGLGGLACYCDVDCANISVSGQELTICEDEIQELTLDINSIVGDPTSLSLTFTDVLGNETLMNSTILYGVTPKSPGAIYQEDPVHVQILPFWVTASNVILSKNSTDYQIWKFVNSRDNTVLLKDWSSKSWSTIFDRDVVPGTLYGYAIRFRGEFGEVSELSSWVEVDLQVH